MRPLTINLLVAAFALSPILIPRKLPEVYRGSYDGCPVTISEERSGNAILLGPTSTQEYLFARDANKNNIFEKEEIGNVKPDGLLKKFANPDSLTTIFENIKSQGKKEIISNY